MSKENENSVVPKLRFPQFNDIGEWEYSKIENYIELISGIPIAGEDLVDDISGVPVLRGINVTEGYIRHSKDIDKYYLGSIEPIKKYFVTENDLVIAMDGSKVGKNVALITKRDENSILIQRVARIRANQKTDINYIYQHIFSEYFQKYVDKVNTSSGIPHISAQQIKDFEIGFPSLKEQQKIADCLSSLDDLIAAETEKLCALQAHKKGLMQQLFPAEGETVPRLRFKEFEGSGEWEEKTLGEICKMQAGKFVSASNIFEKQQSDMYPCYGGNGLRGYTKTYTHHGVYSLIGRQGALCGNITLADGYFHATEHAVVTTPKENINTDWLYYELIRLNLNRFATGQAQPGLSVDVLEKIISSVPSNPLEQQKIADCLTTVDDSIAAQTDTIAQLKQHKQGLMQQLFPSPEGAV